MRRLNFTITLREDVIFSERSASTGGHSCLDHLPGSTFLGYCAGKLYTNLKDQAYTVFHSGQVRFNNAYPLLKCSTPTIPVPLCWHLEKGKSIEFYGDKLVNLIHTHEKTFELWEKEGIQQKQIRTGFFAQSGCYLTPDRQYRLKTAIDRNKLGRAADSQLFGYESLVAGSRWFFSIDLDDTVSHLIDEQLLEVLNGKSLRIGHSRTAEYGLVEAQKNATLGAFHAEGGTSDTLLLVYALSDLALRDPQTGMPTLKPDPQFFSLKHVVFAADKSYLRTRSYAPFNWHRRTFELERQVIGKGSVLAFRREEGTFNTKEINNCRTAVAGGVGVFRYDGLGQVLVQPKFLEATYPINLTQNEPVEEGLTASNRGSNPLKDWLNTKAAKVAVDQLTIATVAGWIETLVAKNSLDRLPNNSQWGQLRNIAINAVSAGDLKVKLFHRDDNNSRNSRGFCSHGISAKQWNKTFEYEGQRIPYRDFLKNVVLGEETDFATLRSRLYLLANRVPRRVNQLIREVEK